MILLLIALLFICLWRISFHRFNEGFLSKATTTAVKGVFVVLIFCSHIREFMVLSPQWWNTSYTTILDHLGQLIVAVFFLYSGYGIWESLKRKPDYPQHFFKNRFLKTLFHFDVAVLLFIIVQLFIPITYSAKRYVFCWIGWESVGNYNWFIFVILVLYLIALTALLLQQRKTFGGIWLTVLLTAGLWAWLNFIMHKPAWWIDTMAAFPLGMVLSRYKDSVTGALEQLPRHILITVISLVFMGIIHMEFGLDIYGLAACAFCCLIVVLTSWINIGNPALAWLGKNAFTIFIIQRLPMIVLSSAGIDQFPALFVMLSLALTLLLAEGLSRLYLLIDKRLFAYA